MKRRRIQLFFAGVLLFAMVMCLTGCGVKPEKFPELYIDPETYSTGFQSELGAVPVIFLRSGDNTAKAVFAGMLSGQWERSELGTYEIKEDVLTVTFPESGEVIVFVVLNRDTIMLVQEKSTWKHIQRIPERTLFHCIGTVTSEDVME